MSCVFGTVIEFGADITTGPRRDRRPIRWYGIALAHETEWLVAHGPYRHPAHAHRQATAWLVTARAYAISLHAPTEPVEQRSLRPRLGGR